MAVHTRSLEEQCHRGEWDGHPTNNPPARPEAKQQPLEALGPPTRGVGAPAPAGNHRRPRSPLFKIIKNFNMAEHEACGTLPGARPRQGLPKSPRRRPQNHPAAGLPRRPRHRGGLGGVQSGTRAPLLPAWLPRTDSLSPGPAQGQRPGHPDRQVGTPLMGRGTTAPSPRLSEARSGHTPPWEVTPPSPGPHCLTHTRRPLGRPATALALPTPGLPLPPPQSRGWGLATTSPRPPGPDRGERPLSSQKPPLTRLWAAAPTWLRPLV